MESQEGKHYSGSSYKSRFFLLHISAVVGPLYQWVLHPWVPGTWGQKYFLKSCIHIEHICTFFLSLFPKPYIWPLSTEHLHCLRCYQSSRDGLKYVGGCVGLCKYQAISVRNWAIHRCYSPWGSWNQLPLHPKGRPTVSGIERRFFEDMVSIFTSQPLGCGQHCLAYSSRWINTCLVSEYFNKIRN